MSLTREQKTLALVLFFAFLLLVALLPFPFSQVGQMVGNQDEGSSLQYMTHVALEKTLFTLDNAKGGDFIMAFHPPLYYVVGASLLLWTTALALPQQLLVLKLFSILLGVAGIAFSYHALKQVFSHSFAILTALFLAVWPTHVYFSTTANNYALVYFFYPLLVYLLLRNWQKAFTTAKVMAIAVLSILLALTHLTTLTSIPLAVSLFAYKNKVQSNAWGRGIKQGLLFLSVVAVPSLALMLFFKQSTGNLLPTAVFLELVPKTPAAIGAYLRSLFVYFFNQFDPKLSAPPALYAALFLLALASLLGFALFLARFRAHSQIQRAFLLGGLTVFAVMVFWQLTYEVPVGFAQYGRRWLDFIPFAPAFFLLGLKQFAERFKRSPHYLYGPAYLILLAFLAHYYFF